MISIHKKDRKLLVFEPVKPVFFGVTVIPYSTEIATNDDIALSVIEKLRTKTLKVGMCVSGNVYVHNDHSSFRNSISHASDNGKYAIPKRGFEYSFYCLYSFTAIEAYRVTGEFRCAIASGFVDILSEPLVGDVHFAETGEDLIGAFGLCGMFAFISVGAFIIVKSSTYMSGFEKLLEDSDFSRRKKELRRDGINLVMIYWLVLVAAFLAVSFIFDSWKWSWVIFAVGGVLTPVVAEFEKMIRRKDK